MSDQQNITIEVDGKKLEATPGQMLIEVTDAAGITVPRFCYHKKLSVAANCRMCLVEVENAPKPLPACATPVADGMKAWTCSPLARQAQKGTMEFLLINHPLDCPICDQGGECELQDVAMGFGEGISRFSEGKRVVPSQNIGPLIATDMTRCIHCTRCVRFGDEIAGIRELGATGRGEHMKIGVYVENSVSSELSGNIIDLCPVGALTSKPFRYRARAWELTTHDSVAAHDGVGSNIQVHVRNHQVMRVVPRDNEAVNETWISDRDRFSYQGMYSEDRLQKPLLRKDGELQEVEWQEALLETAEVLRQAEAERLGALVSPSSTLEEMYLLQKLLRALGSGNIDHRLRQSDFRGDEADPALPWMGQRFDDLENNQAVLLVGSWLRKDQPLLNHHVRKSVLAGGQVMAVNPVDYDFNYELSHKLVVSPADMVTHMAAVAAVLGADTAGLDAKADASHQAIAEALKSAERGLVLLGSVAQMHPDYALLRQLANNIAQAADVDLGFVGDGANSTGAWLAGAVPHKDNGLSLAGMQKEGLDACVLLNVEPEFDTANPGAMAALLSSAKVVALSTHISPWLEQYADVVLPVAASLETSGSFVNLQGDVQSFNGAARPVGEARPAWKVLRVLGNLTNRQGFDYESSQDVLDEALETVGEISPDNSLRAEPSLSVCLQAGDDLQRIGGVPLYSMDMLVRRSGALQHTPDAWKAGLRINADTASQLGLSDGGSAVLRQGEGELTLPLTVDERVPANCVWMPTGVPGSELLGEGFGAVSLEKA
ncbi:NADH-quinone oxidoreductase subunit NuoG [Thiolapillus sp.]|uniref:NADH-quinone oxidoreductase subunit NuoG n=3 Tax=Thiolapillus sp. TaxID=2017437 RepID=UPI0025FAD5C9|nr:NADH-quinone oxidoreductase subunit NuoG [Thiolapillus sp.]